MCLSGFANASRVQSKQLSARPEENRGGKKDSDCTDFLGYSLTGCFIKRTQKLNAFADADVVKKTY